MKEGHFHDYPMPGGICEWCHRVTNSPTTDVTEIPLIFEDHWFQSPYSMRPWWTDELGLSSGLLLMVSLRFIGKKRDLKKVRLLDIVLLLIVCLLVLVLLCLPSSSLSSFFFFFFWWWWWWWWMLCYPVIWWWYEALHRIPDDNQPDQDFMECNKGQLNTALLPCGKSIMI